MANDSCDPTAAPSEPVKPGTRMVVATSGWPVSGLTNRAVLDGAVVKRSCSCRPLAMVVPMNSAVQPGNSLPKSR